MKIVLGKFRDKSQVSRFVASKFERSREEETDTKERNDLKLVACSMAARQA